MIENDYGRSIGYNRSFNNRMYRNKETFSQRNFGNIGINPDFPITFSVYNLKM